MKRHELSEEQWNRIKDLLPPERNPKGGPQAKDNRMMLNGIIYWLNTGVPWRDLPERFGPWNSVYTRYSRWTIAGVWQKVLDELMEKDIVDDTELMLDSTIIKVHQHGSGKKGANARGAGSAD